MIKLTTLCYLETEEQYLMLHRTKKEQDENKDKWIGVGGKFEYGESPEDCLLREVKEETGYTLRSWRFRGIVTFVYGEDTVEYMHLYTADKWDGTPVTCTEGDLEWVKKADIWKRNLWEGDRIFFRLLTEETPFFSLKLIYNIEGTLKQAVLNGKELELFDILNEDGTKSGIVRERGVAHLDGSLHATVHIWIARPNAESGYDILLQRRSHHKDSSPDCLDISSAGHISTGDDFLPSAMREAKEELGLTLDPGKLKELGFHQKKFEGEFYGRPFKDNQLSKVYLYIEAIDITKLTLQEEEVSEVIWMDYAKCKKGIQENTIRHCIYLDEFEMVGKGLGIDG